MREELAEASHHHLVSQVKHIREVGADDGVQVSSFALLHLLRIRFLDQILRITISRDFAQLQKEMFQLGQWVCSRTRATKVSYGILTIGAFLA